MTKMNNTISMNDIVANVVAGHAIVLDRDKDAKVARGFCNAAKVDVYTKLMCDIVLIGTLKSGGLEKGQVMKLKAAMLANGITEACATRYCANANGVIKECPEIAAIARNGRHELTAYFAEKEIDTETKIRALHVKPDCPLKALAERVVKLSTDDYATFAEWVRVLQEIEAAKVAPMGEVELAGEE
jgi:hypothetical protein